MKKILLAAAISALSVGAQASTFNYSFNEVVKADGSHKDFSRSVASLEIKDGDDFLPGFIHSVDFTLKNTFDGALGSHASAMTNWLSFSGEALGLLWPSDFSPTEFEFNFNKNFDFIGPDYKVVFKTSSTGAFGDGESVSWTIFGGDYLDASDFNSFLLKVNATGGYYDQGGNLKGSGNLYFAAAPVPEPESYAMLLAGLGVIGAVVRRRKAQAH